MQRSIGRVAATVPTGRRGWWWAARLDDSRYPRPKPVAALRAVGRFCWLPITVYVGNAATGLLTLVAVQGPVAATNTASLTHAFQLDAFLALARRNPPALVFAPIILVLLVALVRVAYLDARREIAVVRSRELLRWMQERAGRALTVERLGDDLRALQDELASDAGALPADADARTIALAGRLASLTAISEMLSRDLAMRAVWDTLMERQMAAWARRQRLWSLGMSVASIAAGGLLPVLINPGVLGG